mmetsp:Transcript_102418/g.153495  ORF Transcript_102418/g.153495 Transcript_102418/m.153495 type:complete len:615 (-) Transcript_102418:400-2244(-)
MSDERVAAITSAINNLNSGLGVTDRSITEYLARNPWTAGLSNEVIAQSFVSAQVQAQVQAQAASQQAQVQAQAAFQQGLQQGLQLNRNTSGRRQQPIRPPDVAPTTASSLENSSPENRAKKARYDTEILPQKLYENSFVHVRSYFRFVKGCAEATAEGNVPKDEARKCFGPDAYQTWCPVENLTGLKETKRSLALCRAFGKELHDEMCLDVQHQTPISPNKSKLKQDADVCFFVQSDVIGGVASGERIIAELEYKPESTFPGYESQACAYGTDLMSIHNSPIIIIQAHGESLSLMNYRAFGVVPNFMTNDSEEEIEASSAEYRKVLLFEGHGFGGFAAIAAGLRGCVAGLKQDRSFDSFDRETKVSSVASVHSIDGEWLFIKSYDYRLRPETAMGDRRQANLRLVRGWIDEDAKHFQLGTNLEVVISRFYQQSEDQDEWYAPFPVSNLGLILDALAELHKQGYVHGDIRLFNFLLHVGKLVDFDHTRQAGGCYPNTLRPLGLDGKRAKAVSKAIDAKSLSTLKMDFEHDLESMMHALQLLQPTTDAPKEFADWWDTKVRNMSDFGAVLSLRKEIAEEFSDPSNRLEVKASIKNYLGDSYDPVLTATDSPSKPRT